MGKLKIDMKKILCVTDKKGWCLNNIMKTLRSYITSYKLDVIALKEEKFRPEKYDLVYYTHFSLYDKAPCNNKKVGTITSHKCLNNMKKTLKKMSVFDRVSVNSMILFDIFAKSIPSLYFTPSGVDTRNFSFKDKSRNKKLVLGWVGNKDRDVKNYESVWKPLRKRFKNIEFREVATKKGDRQPQFLTPKQMADFYHGLDFFLVTSSSEGTPNPGLEALSCGVPSISTRVGNMVEIVEDGKSGFFCDDNIDSFVKRIEKVKTMSNEDYRVMSILSRDKMISWDWSIITEKYQLFFESVL